MFFTNAICQNFILVTGLYQPNTEMNNGTVKQKQLLHKLLVLLVSFFPSPSASNVSLNEAM